MFFKKKKKQTYTYILVCHSSELINDSALSGLIV